MKKIPDRIQLKKAYMCNVILLLSRVFVCQYFVSRDISLILTLSDVYGDSQVKHFSRKMPPKQSQWLQRSVLVSQSKPSCIQIQQNVF